LKRLLLTSMAPGITSPLARGRGLKQIKYKLIRGCKLVAPRAGAWIETPHLAQGEPHLSSPLARGRGLKPLQKR